MRRIITSTPDTSILSRIRWQSLARRSLRLGDSTLVCARIRSRRPDLRRMLKLPYDSRCRLSSAHLPQKVNKLSSTHATAPLITPWIGACRWG